MIDETLHNNNRRAHQIVSHPVYDILPDYFVETYPKIAEFLISYYRGLHQGDFAAKEIHDLLNTSDITAIDDKYLVYLEETLLLGQNSFKGLNDSRLALKMSANLYGSKGSKYSLEQFFRIFLGVDAEVIYTKENVFIVDESLIGPDSLRFLVNDKLYQTFAILIRTSLSVSDWIDIYKQFVHPAGLYVEGETQIVSVANVFPVDLFMPYVPLFEPDEIKLVLESPATWLTEFAYVDATAVVID